MADRIALLNNGRNKQLGLLEEMYYLLASLHKTRFLGLTNLFPGIVINNDDMHIA
jgi:ABC-type Fe3+/spermidine/putrescine transport system ATPase subunit